MKKFAIFAAVVATVALVRIRYDGFGQDLQDDDDLRAGRRGAGHG